jgi:hypothetical protein
VVDPKKKLFFVHRSGAPSEILTVSDTLRGEPVLPGWAFPVGDAFSGDEATAAA